MLKLPDDEFVSLELVHESGDGRVDPTGVSHLVIGVDALDRTLTYLAARGIETEAPDLARWFAGSVDGLVD